LLLGDAYTYKIIVAAESYQVPVDSKEQHASAQIDCVTEAVAVDTSLLASMTPSKRVFHRGAGAKVMFKLVAPKVLTPMHDLMPNFASKEPLLSTVRASLPTRSKPTNLSPAKTLFTSKRSPVHNTTEVYEVEKDVC
jgi:hypothetical protein